MKETHRALVGIIFSAFGIVCAAGSLVWVWSYYRYAKMSPVERSLYQQIEASRKAYANDSLGGATPEETWSLFLQALKHNDIDRASDYFDLKIQKSWSATLYATRNAGQMPAVLKNLSKGITRESGDRAGDYAHYYYDIESGGTLHHNPVIFWFNRATRRWKISFL